MVKERGKRKRDKARQDPRQEDLFPETERAQKAPSVVSRQAAITELVLELCDQALQIKRDADMDGDVARLLSRRATVWAQMGNPRSDTGWFKREKTDGS